MADTLRLDISLPNGTDAERVAAAVAALRGMALALETHERLQWRVINPVGGVVADARVIVDRR